MDVVYVTEDRKIKIKLPDGTEFEGTLEDYKTLKAEGLLPNGRPTITGLGVLPSEQEKSFHTHLPTKQQKMFHAHPKDNDVNRYNKGWLDHENVIIKQFWEVRKCKKNMLTKEIKNIAKALPGRTVKSIRVQITKLKQTGFLKFTKNRNAQADVSAVATTPKPVNSIMNYLTDAEFATVRTMLHLPIAEIAKSIGKQQNQLSDYLEKVHGGIRKLRKQNNIIGKSNMRQEFKDKATERMRFMSSRAAVYMKQYNWSREKACQQASEDWQNGGRGILPGLQPDKPKPKPDKNFEDTEFPKFMYLTKEGNDMLMQIVKNVIANKGVIGYRDLSHLPKEDNNDWNRQDWLQFIDEFLKRSPRICAHFLSPNKFKLAKAGNGYEVIQYE